MHPRTILESQFLSIRSRVNQLLAEGSPDLHRLILTGGGSSNQVIRQLAAVSLLVPLLYLIQYLSRTYSMWTYMFPQRSKQQATGARYWLDMLGGNNHIPIGQLGIWWMGGRAQTLNVLPSPVPMQPGYITVWSISMIFAKIKWWRTTGKKSKYSNLSSDHHRLLHSM